MHKTCRTQIKIPQLKALAKIIVKMHVTQMNRHYDVIMGWDVLSKLAIILDLKNNWCGGATKFSK